MNTYNFLALINQHLKNYESYSQTNTNYVKQVLYKYTLRKLRKIICDVTEYGKYELSSTYDHTLLRDFLKEFYSIVKDTDALPLHTPNSGLSVIMMELATMLEKYFTNKSRFELLMPSINITDYIISATSLHDSALELRDFVMNDDGTCLIEVLNCLKFAKEDGILKHTCLFSGKIKNLSASEKNRVITHSQQTTDYWNAIQNKISITIEGNNFGAVLRRLIRGLQNGSAYSQRDGNEYDAGIDANVAIVDFFIWYDSISTEERYYLDHKTTKTQTKKYYMKQLLDRLKRPASFNFKNSIFCVEIIANEIGVIVDDNDDLFNTYPVNSIVETLLIEQAINSVTIAERNLEQALENSDYNVTATYAVNAPSAILLNNLSALPDLDFYVGKRTTTNMLRTKNTSSVKFKA